MRLPPNPNYLAEIEKTKAIVQKAKDNRDVAFRVIAAETGIHSNIIIRFMKGQVENPRKDTVEALRKWGEANKAAKVQTPDEVKKEIGQRLKAAYEVQKAKPKGGSTESMALAAGVNRTVFSQLMNGTYTRELRPFTINALNAWIKKAGG